MKLIFSDIDGTLAIGKNVPPSAAAAISTFREKGNGFFICTGRQLSYVLKNFAKYADGYICNNGRLVFYKSEVIYSKPIAKETVKEIMDILKSLDAGYVFYGLEKQYYRGPMDGYKIIKEAIDTEELVYGFDENTDSFFNADIFYHDKEQCDQIEEALRDHCILNRHGNHPSADLTILGVDKGDALKAVVNKLRIPISDTYAFGDGVNDICMLKTAGHGIAMGNADEKTKDVAEFVTTAISEDGIANGLKHYGLI